MNSKPATPAAPKPTTGRILRYRGKEGLQAVRAAMVTCDVDTLLEGGAIFRRWTTISTCTCGCSPRVVPASPSTTSARVMPLVSGVGRRGK